MIDYPVINKIAIQIGPFKIYWYGLMYLFGFIAAWSLARYRIRKGKGVAEWSNAQLEDLFFYCILGVIIGGRVGYVLFYDIPSFFQDPLSLFKIWQGGMSFHGGFLGVLVGCYFFARKSGKKFFDVGDFLAPLVPIALAFGRIGNFINNELWGMVTNVPWGIVFPGAGELPRHPSQIYEFFLEGVLFFLFLWVYSERKKPTMAVSAMFLMWYGVVRFCVEFFRSPDPQYGFIAFGWVTMGQILSAPMIIAGIILLVLAYKGKEFSAKEE